MILIFICQSKNFSVGVLLLHLTANEQGERSSRSPSCLCRRDGLKLHAQRKTLQLIIEVVVRVFVETQRRDAYYRNDPSKYGLNVKGKIWFDMDANSLCLVAHISSVCICNA